MVCSKISRFGLIVCLIVFQCSCHSASKKNHESAADLSGIKIGMSFVDVMNIAGAPDTIIHWGFVEDTFHNQTRTNEWHYGNNQIVVMVNDTVSSIDLNAEATRLQIQHIIDSARAAEGGSNPFIRPLQQ